MCPTHLVFQHGPKTTTAVKERRQVDPPEHSHQHPSPSYCEASTDSPRRGGEILVGG